MGKVETALSKSVVLIFLAALLFSARAIASDDLSQYGLGSEGLTLSKQKSDEKIFLEKPSAFHFARDFEDDFKRYAVNKTIAQKQQQDLNQFVLQLDFDYQDTAADFSSSFHGFNSNLNNKLNHTSNEYQTRMGYQFNHLNSEAVFNYSPDSYGFGKYYNYELGVSVPIKEVFSLETRYGWNKFDKQTSQGGMNDYQDWRVGVSTTYKGMKLKVDYIDMNASESSQECGKTFSCEGKTVFSIIKNF